MRRDGERLARGQALLVQAQLYGRGLAHLAGQTSAELNNPSGVGVDAAGNLLLADSSNNRVRVVAAATSTFYGQAMTAGNIYTIAGGGTSDPGDGGPATAAVLEIPGGIAVDSAGNVLIATSDVWDRDDNRVRVVAATTGTFYGQAMTAGNIYTVAGGTSGLGDGGPATSAVLGDPAAVAMDAAGNLLIADTYYIRIRIVAG